MKQKRKLENVQITKIQMEAPEPKNLDFDSDNSCAEKDYYKLVNMSDEDLFKKQKKKPISKFQNINTSVMKYITKKQSSYDSC
mgnify:CR=1 FL=1